MFKNIFLFVLFSFFFSDYSFSNQLDLLRQRLEGLDFSRDPVGTVKTSILTESQFQAEMSTDWVAMEGQSIAGSRLCTEKSICTLPDARSRFLRNADGSDTNLRGLVADTTAQNGITLSNTPASNGTLGVSYTAQTLTGSTSFAAASHSHTVNSHTHDYYHNHQVAYMSNADGLYWNATDDSSRQSWNNGTGGTHRDPYTGALATTGSTTGYGAIDYSTSKLFLSGGVYSGVNGVGINAKTSATAPGTSASSNSSIGISAGGASLTGSVSGGTASISASDSETAPNHMIVNYFVKIN